MRLFAILIFILLASLSNAFGQALDISSGGVPSISGTLSGYVTGSSSVLNNLTVTVNFGEVSPLNTSNIVKVTVPVAVRSNQAYKVVATVTGGTNANAQAIQRTDIGFGITNWRAMGSNSRVCTNSSHIFYTPFNNDPSTNVTTNATGRVVYTSDLSDIGSSATILSGPRLSNGNNNRQNNDGYIFDAIFTLTPQFFATGSTTAVLTLTISAGPTAPC
ncbi:hypothetical protein BH10ACI3_BH10ACI3_12240 [soil metagenome]